MASSLSLKWYSPPKFVPKEASADPLGDEAPTKEGLNERTGLLAVAPNSGGDEDMV
jgi:hypothetical protein